VQFSFESIGIFRGPWKDKADAPRQPRAAEGAPGLIEVFAGYEDALADLDVWDTLWVVFVFDRAEGWKPKVLPPRSTTKRGVFSTRAPRRPNAIGISALRLTKVVGREVHVEDADLLDGTPVLDLKPYVAWTDARPDAGGGWLAEDPGRSWEVRIGERADEQLAWLAARGVDLRSRVVDHLGIGPHPHAYRRIKARSDGSYVLAVKTWRVGFRIEGGVVRVDEVRCGEKRKRLDETQAAFVAAFE